VARILSVSYDELLLSTRELILHNRGYKVVSARGFSKALKHCQSREKFDLFILGHSIPHSHKESLIAAFRTRSSASVIALIKYGERPVHSADFQIEPNPEQLLQLVEKVISGQANAAG
jgi:DNA-binding NtrC family response regulator